MVLVCLKITTIHCKMRIKRLKAIGDDPQKSGVFYIKTYNLSNIAQYKILISFIENFTSEEMAQLVTHIKFRNSNLATISNRLFTHFPNVEILDASHSKLKSLSSLSFNKSNLSYIFLYHNRLDIIRDHIFVHCPELKILDLSENEITKVGKFAFKHLSRLEKLDLSRNKIQRLEDGTFEPLTSLEWLWLSKNNLTRISAKLFTIANKNLVTVFVENNKINSISPNAFDFLENLRFLFLTGNECISREFKNHVIHDNLAVAYELRKCYEKHRKTHTYEPDRNLTAEILTATKRISECQGYLEFKTSELGQYEKAIKQFKTNDEEDYYESSKEDSS